MTTNSPVSEIERSDDLLIPVGSETVAASRYRPVDLEEPAPALLMYIPYRRGDFMFDRYDPLTEYLAMHGYEVVTADILGTGASSGQMREPFIPDEGKQASKIIGWLADQEWTNGKVGMYGSSYGGETALRAAAEAPDALEAIVPIHTPHTMYESHTQGGAAELYRMGGRWGPMMQVLQTIPPSPRDANGRWTDVWMDHLAALQDGEPWLFQMFEHDTRDGYWEGKDVPVEQIDIPTLAVTGWRDSFNTETLEYFEQLNGEKRLIIGPWRHTLPYAGRDAPIDFRRRARDWFDHFLKDKQTDSLDRSPIEYWTESYEHGDLTDGAWRGRDDWVYADDAASSMSFALTPVGIVDVDDYQDGIVDREYEYDHTVGVHSTEDVIQAACMPPDTGADDARSVVFESAPVDNPIEITGTGKMRLRFTATTPDPNLSVRLIDVGPQGAANLVTHREVRPSQHEESQEVGEFKSGEEYEISFDFRPVSHLFQQNHRIRLSMSAGLFPAMMPPREHGSFRFFSSPENPSVITMPGRIHSTSPTFNDTVEVSPPDGSLPVEPKRRTHHSSWEVTRDHVNRSATVTVMGQTQIDLPYADAFEYESEIRASIRENDPGTLELVSKAKCSIDYGTDVFETNSWCRVSRDLLQLETDITMNEMEIFDESWTRPR